MKLNVYFANTPIHTNTVRVFSREITLYDVFLKSSFLDSWTLTVRKNQSMILAQRSPVLSLGKMKIPLVRIYSSMGWGGGIKSI